jgi:glycosyltransferase involved in cell wall biosynthesis
MSGTGAFALVIPIYKNEGSIPALLDALDRLRQRIGRAFRVVFVVDGSPDRCAELLASELPRRIFASRLLVHSRNFGSFAAIRSGLKDTEADFYAVMAADLQEPPELVEQMHAVLTTDAADVVLGVRRTRQDPWLARLTSTLFWKVYRRLVQSAVPPGGVDMFACNRVVRDRLIAMDEANSTLVGLVIWLGFRRQVVQYDRLARQHGRSAWTFRSKLKYMRDSAYAFSDLPLRVLTLLGSVGILVATVLGAIVLALRLTHDFAVPGYAAVMLVVLFFGGANLLGIGIIGAYVWRAFENTKGRPHAAVMHAASFGESE